MPTLNDSGARPAWMADTYFNVGKGTNFREMAKMGVRLERYRSGEGLTDFFLTKGQKEGGEVLGKFKKV